MANIGDRPNLKICIDNTEEGSDSDDAVRLEEDVGDIIVQDDAASDSDAGESYTESGGKIEHSESSAAEDDDEIQRAILEANIPADELRELSPEPLPVPVNKLKTEQTTERVAPKPQKLNIPRADKERLEDVDIEVMYESLGFTIAQLEKSNDRGIRLEAIHMRGIEDMEESDVMQYFSEFQPSSVEWIDDESCNIVWQDPMKAAHAMLKLSVVSQLNVDSDSDSQETMDTEENPEAKGKEAQDDDDELNLLSDQEDRETGEKVPAKMVEKRLRQTGDDQMDVDGDGQKEEGTNGKDKEEGEMDTDDEKMEDKENRSTRKRRNRLKVPPGKWRIGVAHSKAEVLFLRFANKADVPLPGAEHKRKFRKKFTKPRIGAEGLISESKRREMKAKQDELEIEKAKEALLKKQRPLEDHSIPDFLLEDVPELPEEFAAYPDPVPKPERPKVRELHSKSSMQDKRLRMKRKRSDSDDSPETDVEEELNALLKPKSPKRLPIGRMHADEEEEKIQAVRSRTLDPSHVDPTDARSLIVRRRHKRKMVTQRRERNYDRYDDRGSDDSWEDQSEEEEEDHETFGVSSARRSRSSRHEKNRVRGYRSRHSGIGRHSRDNKPNLKDLPSLTIQVEAD